MTASQRPGRVDRAALIEAAGFAVARDRSAPYGPQTEDYECATAVLDAVLPLVADAIEACRPHIPPSTDMKRREAIIVRCTLNRAARLVRSLGDEQ